MSANKLAEDSVEKKKKKKTTSIEIFDVLTNNTGIRTNNAFSTGTTLSQAKTLHSNAARWNEALAPKTFLMKKKKAKGLSIFKKKILMERLKVHIKNNIENKVTSATNIHGNDTVKTLASSAGSVIHVYNYIDDVDCSDPDEAMEACNDLKDLLQSTGNILGINVLSLNNQQGQKISQYSSFVEVTLSNLNEAISAVEAINGIICGGKPILAALKDIQICDIPISTGMNNSTSMQPSLSTNSASSTNQLSSSGRIIISNMITEDVLQDEEEMQEIISDVHDLCSMFGSISRVWAEYCPSLLALSKPSCDEPHTILALSKIGLDEPHTPLGCIIPVQPRDPWVLLQCTSVDSAMTAISNLRGKIVGGSTILADYYDYYSYTHDVYDEKLIITDIEVESSIWLRLRGFASLDEISDEDERAEVLDNLLALLLLAGIDSTQDAVRFIRFPESCMDVENPSVLLLDVCVPVVGVSQAMSARAHLAQQCMAGKALQVDVVTMQLSALTTPSGLYYDAAKSSDEYICRSICNCRGSMVVVVRSFLTLEDLEEEDGLVQVKRDLLQLAFVPSDHVHTISAGTVSRVHIVSNNNIITVPIGSNDADGNSGSSSFGSAGYVVGVDFRVETDALDAMLQLDGRMVSGASLTVHCYSHIEGFESTCRDGSIDFATRSIIASKEYNTELTSDYAQGTARAPLDMQKYRCVFSVGYEQPTLSSSLDQLPTALDHCSHDSPSPLTVDSTTQNVAEVGDSEKTPNGMSKYREARAVPKLEVHSQPNLPLPIADEASNAAIKELLRLISTFQARLKEKTPQKAKQKLRFVAGLKQCTNSVKGGKVRLLLLAPNTEVCDTIDDKIETLIEEARLRDVPACYCLSKRILGKAAQMTMKQSVIAVLDPDGAYQYFKIILNFIKPSN